jgi:hypothetical protein
VGIDVSIAIAEVRDCLKKGNINKEEYYNVPDKSHATE